MDLTKVRLIRVTHSYARRALLACARLCGLDDVPMWSVHEAHLLDPRTGETHIVGMDAHEITDPSVFELLEPHFTY